VKKKEIIEELIQAMGKISEGKFRCQGRGRMGKIWFSDKNRVILTFFEMLNNSFVLVTLLATYTFALVAK
jgi:biotin-(acetyl-CoA carboxylase) ligase